jgi:hypothetical protein
MSHSASIAKDVNPQIARAAAEVGILLDDYHYSPHARDRIVRYTIAHGTPTGCPELDREDEADASAVFEAELEPVPFDSPAWDRDGGVYLDVPSLIDGTHPLPFAEPEPDEATLISHEAPDGRHVALKMIGNGALPPISGGAPAPTAADRRDFEAWLSQVDAPYPPDDQAEPMRAWYRRHPVAEFNNDLRTD